MSWIHAINAAHNNILFPNSATESGFFSPLNCFGQAYAINQAMSEMTAAAKHTTAAADQTFLVKPVNIPMPQALNSSRLLVVHNDAAAKAAAHMALAVKNLKVYRTAGPDGLPLDQAGLFFDPVLMVTSTQKRQEYNQFIYQC